LSPHNRHKIAAKSARNRRGITSQLPHKRITITAQTLRNHLKANAKPQRNSHAIATQSPKQLKRNRVGIALVIAALSQQRNRHTIAAAKLPLIRWPIVAKSRLHCIAITAKTLSMKTENIQVNSAPYLNIVRTIVGSSIKPVQK